MREINTDLIIILKVNEIEKIEGFIALIKPNSNKIRKRKGFYKKRTEFGCE